MTTGSNLNFACGRVLLSMVTAPADSRNKEDPSGGALTFVPRPPPNIRWYAGNDQDRASAPLSGAWSARARCRCATTSCSPTGPRGGYLVLPGITGLWQVSGRSDLDFDDMVRLDFLYLERWSVLLDLVILLKTVLRRKGTY